jgi:hypothetical protein
MAASRSSAGICIATHCQSIGTLHLLILLMGRRRADKAEVIGSSPLRSTHYFLVNLEPQWLSLGVLFGAQLTVGEAFAGRVVRLEYVVHGLRASLSTGHDWRRRACAHRRRGRGGLRLGPWGNRAKCATSDVPTAGWQLSAVARWPTVRMIPAAIFPGGSAGRKLRFTPVMVLGPHQRDSGQHSGICRQRCESEGAVSAGSSVWPTRMGGWLCWRAWLSIEGDGFGCR